MTASTSPNAGPLPARPPEPAAAAASSPAARCARCGVAQDCPDRDFFPQWFIDAAGQPVCPRCVSGQVVTATLTLINARAILPRFRAPLPPAPAGGLAPQGDKP